MTKNKYPELKDMQDFFAHCFGVEVKPIFEEVRNGIWGVSISLDGWVIPDGTFFFSFDKQKLFRYAIDYPGHLEKWQIDLFNKAYPEMAEKKDWGGYPPTYIASLELDYGLYPIFYKSKDPDVFAIQLFTDRLKPLEGFYFTFDRRSMYFAKADYPDKLSKYGLKDIFDNAFPRWEKENVWSDYPPQECVIKPLL